MSGGSLNYISFTIESVLCGKMEDIELNHLIQDIANLTHDLEWYLSGDTEESTYKESVHKFKHKWFKKSRNKRLREYIDETLDNTKKELYNMIGE